MFCNTVLPSWLNKPSKAKLLQQGQKLYKIQIVKKKNILPSFGEAKWGQAWDHCPTTHEYCSGPSAVGQGSAVPPWLSNFLFFYHINAQKCVLRPPLLEI